jgi:hypothetical protein
MLQVVNAARKAGLRIFYALEGQKMQEMNCFRCQILIPFM